MYIYDSSGKECFNFTLTSSSQSYTSTPLSPLTQYHAVLYNSNWNELAGVYATTNSDLATLQPEDVTRAIAEFIIENPLALNATQQGWFPDLFYAAGFVRDSNGVYHTRQDALQQFGGYNDFYDAVFHYATSMDKLKNEFLVVELSEEFNIWLWKGDYMNLGAGAEIGIYYGGGPQWLCGTQYAMPMTLKLKDNNGNTIFDWNPTEDNWWCTGFNPDYQDRLASNLTAYGSIDFSDHLDMWTAFYNRYNGLYPWTFDTANHIASFVW